MELPGIPRSIGTFFDRRLPPSPNDDETLLPNPFNPTTVITFTVPEAGHAALRIYDMLGREVATLYDDIAPAGRILQAPFDARVLASGMYFYRLTFVSQLLQRRMVVLK